MYARVSYLFTLSFVVLLLSSCQEKLQDRFVREAREYTEKYCPQPHVNGITTLDSMVFTPNDSIIGDLKIYYSLQLTDEQRTLLTDKLGEIGDLSLTEIRNSVLFGKHKDAGASFTYIYHDAEKGDKIAEYHITREEYE